MTINDLPDDDLLATFDFYVVRHEDLDLRELSDYDTKRKIESWQSLVHVCRRWRGLVFGSPRRLNLQLFFIPGTSARKTLDVWPVLPLIIQGDISETSVDNVIAELEHSDRICQFNLDCRTTSQIEKLWTAMQVPFPELVVLHLSVEDLSIGPVLLDSFLGGSTPRLRFLSLVAVPFPALPRLLLSATHLIKLHLHNIPHSGYISPEAMASCLSTLTNLERLHFQFESPQSCPDRENRRSPPPNRSILPALTGFWFKGANEYLEDLVSCIDSPRLYRLSTTFFNDIDFDTPELNRFISRTTTLGTFNEARLIFDSHEALVRLCQFQSVRSDHGMVQVKILCQVSDWQLSSLAQICTLSLPLFSTIEDLYIYEYLHSLPNWKDDIENAEWLDLLLPFRAVKNLYLSKQLSPRIARVLKELSAGRTTEVLPALQNVLLEGFLPGPLELVQEGIRQFISARRLSNHPVAISVWDRDLVRDRS